MKNQNFEFTLEYDNFLTAKGPLFLHVFKSTTHQLSEYVKKLGVSMLFKELWRIWKGHVFACFYVICPIDARTHFELCRARATIWLVKIDSKLMEIVKGSLKIANQVKKRHFYVIYNLRAPKTRARTRTRANF